MGNGLPYESRMRRASVANVKRTSIYPALETKLALDNLSDTFSNSERADAEDMEDDKVSAAIELFARVTFPLSYTLFNICYWATYVKEAQFHEDHVP